MRQLGRLLITGVPGWLSAAVLDDLACKAWPGLGGVCCLVQPGGVFDAAARSAAAAGWEVVRGDLRHVQAVRAAVRGADSVLHAAGIVHVRHTRDWYDVNTEGTRSLARAAAEAGVGRFVFISSNGAAGRAPTAGHVLTESDPPHPLSHYGKSKWLAEQALASLAGRLETVVLRPCMFYGPPVPRRHVEIYRRIQHGRMPLVGDGQFARSLTHIENLVQGCRLALTHPAAAGQTYYIADAPVYTTRQIVEAMAAALQTAPRFLPLPRPTARLAYAVDCALAAVGCYWQALHLVGEADWNVGVSCAKAQRELGYRPTRALAEGMRQAVAWCVAQGLLDGLLGGPSHARHPIHSRCQSSKNSSDQRR